MARMMVPFAFMYLIFLGIVGMGQHMISSIIEEKNSRIIEVLLSAISPFELMAGKIAGLAGVGLAVTALWGAAAYGAARWQGIQIDVGAGSSIVSSTTFWASSCSVPSWRVSARPAIRSRRRRA
jgi:ABC-2 type transport system permease protein